MKAGRLLGALTRTTTSQPPRDGTDASRDSTYVDGQMVPGTIWYHKWHFDVAHWMDGAEYVSTTYNYLDHENGGYSLSASSQIANT